MNSQWIQMAVVGICGLGAAGYLRPRYLPRLRGSCNSCKGCGKGGGCH